MIYAHVACKPVRHLLLAGRPYERSYDGFVDLSREMMKGRNSKQQQQAVSGVLGACPPHRCLQGRSITGRSGLACNVRRLPDA
jgi:hypothetical protein